MSDPTEVTQAEENVLSGARQPVQAARPLSMTGKTWLISCLLLIILAIMVGRTLITGATKEDRAISDVASQTYEALQATKIAYRWAENNEEPAPKPARSVRPSAGKSVSPPPKPIVSSTALLEDAAIGKWKSLTTAHPDYVSPWRKLGLTLYLFHRPGVLNTLRHIGTLPDPKPAQPQGEHGGKIPRRGLLQDSDQQAPLPHKQEVELWQTLFGTEPLDAKRLPDLRGQIEKLNLGWFEDIALAQLYTRAGQKPQAQQYLAAAAQSAESISMLSGVEVLFAILGFFALCLYGVYRFGEWLQRRNLIPYGSFPQPGPASLPQVAYPSNAPFPPATYQPGAPYTPYVPPLPGVAFPQPPAPIPATEPPQEPVGFSYWSRGIAFILYMTVFLLIALPFRFLHPYISQLSSEALLRLNFVLQIVLYIPIVWITLAMLRRLVAAESPGKVRPTWRETLEGLGLFSRRPLEDIGAGIFSYAMAYPVFLTASLLSAWVFRNFHTPINPIEVEIMVSQNRLDQILMLIQASVAAPIVEEMMFRGLLFPALKQRWGTAMGIVLSSACFALVHPNLPAGFLPLWTLGAAFALTFQRRGSLLPNIVMHGLHNGFVTLTLFALFAK